MGLPEPLRNDIAKGVKLRKTPESAYMHAAQQAITNVRSTFGILAANRDSDQAEWAAKKTGTSLDDLVDTAFLEAEANAPFKKVRGEEVREPADVVKAQADAAMKHKAGNCEMQSAVAFEFLKQFQVPLDIMYLQMYDRNVAKPTKKLLSSDIENVKPDHVFVVIGRPKTTDPTNYQTWGKEAVVCDPWARRAYPAHRLGDELEALGTISAGQTKTGSRLRFEP